MAVMRKTPRKISMPVEWPTSSATAKDMMKAAALGHGWLGEVIRLSAWIMISAVIKGVTLASAIMLMLLKMSASAASAKVVGKRWTFMRFRVLTCVSSADGICK